VGLVALWCLVERILRRRPGLPRRTTLAFVPLVALVIGLLPSPPAVGAASTTSFRIGGALFSVAATSADNAWAVGYTGSGPDSRTLLAHWNGRAWTQVTDPSPSSGGLDA
jgi:hypothetical protein